MKGKGLIRICTVFLVIISMLAMNVPMVSAATYAPTVTVKVNPVGTADTVTVKGTTTSYVYGGDIVKVYRVASATAPYSSGTLIGQAVAAGSGSSKTAEAVVSIAQLGSTAGFVQIYVTTNGSDPRSTTAAKKYTAKAKIGKSDPFTKTIPASVYANNYADLDDLVGVNVSDTTKYPDGSIVKVYRSSASKVVLGTGVLSGGKVGIEVPQLGTRAGSVYVSITKSVYYSESTRLAVTYASEVSEAIPAGAISVVNNHDNDPALPTDTVTITASKAVPAAKALAVGDVINVYRGSGSGSTLIGTSGKLTDTGNVTIDLTQDLGVKASKLYVSRTSSGKKPSARTAVSYKGENTSKTLVPAQITYTNNRYGTADIIDIQSTVASQVYLGAVVRLYEEIGGGSPVKSVTVTDATYTRIELPTTSTFLDASGGTFYASIERTGEIESNRVAIKYKGETPLTTAELTTNYGLNVTEDAFVTNNPEGINDEIKVSNLSAGDILRLYATDKTTDKDVIGEATSTGTSATITVAQLPKPTVSTSVYGTVFLTVTPVNSTESARFGLVYSSDTAYTGITAVADNVSNVDGSAMDTIKVSGLGQYDTVTAYDASTGGNQLGSQIVGEGDTTATINLFLPSSSGGTVYIAITKLGADENKNRLSTTYTAEP